MRYIVLEKLYREKAAIFDFDPYHGLFILATEDEEVPALLQSASLCESSLNGTDSARVCYDL